MSHARTDLRLSVDSRQEEEGVAASQTADSSVSDFLNTAGPAGHRDTHQTLHTQRVPTKHQVVEEDWQLNTQIRGHKEEFQELKREPNDGRAHLYVVQHHAGHHHPHPSQQVGKQHLKTDSDGGLLLKLGHGHFSLLLRRLFGRRLEHWW